MRRVMQHFTLLRYNNCFDLTNVHLGVRINWRGENWLAYFVFNNILNKNRTIIITGNLIIIKLPKESVWYGLNQRIVLNHPLPNNIFVAFCSVQETVKCSKVNNGCDKPCASCTTQYVREIRVGCNHKPPGWPGITEPWYLEVGHVTLSGNHWGPSLMRDEVLDDEHAGHGSIFTAFDLRKSCVRQIGKGKVLNRNQVSLAL